MAIYMRLLTMKFETIYHGSGSEKPQNRQQYPNHLFPKNSC